MWFEEVPRHIGMVRRLLLASNTHLVIWYHRKPSVSYLELRLQWLQWFSQSSPRLHVTTSVLDVHNSFPFQAVSVRMVRSVFWTHTATEQFVCAMMASSHWNLAPRWTASQEIRRTVDSAMDRYVSTPELYMVPWANETRKVKKSQLEQSPWYCVKHLNPTMSWVFLS